jgi:hypothetical protein
MNIFTYLWVHHMSYVLNCSSKLIRTHVATIACTHQAHFTRQISDSLITFITSIIHYFVEQFLYKVLICKHLLHSRSCKTILEQLFTFLWSRQPKSCMDQWVHTKKCRFFLTFFVNIYLLKVYLPITHQTKPCENFHYSFFFVTYWWYICNMILQRNCAASQLLVLNMDVYPLIVFPWCWHLIIILEKFVKFPIFYWSQLVSFEFALSVSIGKLYQDTINYIFSI